MVIKKTKKMLGGFMGPALALMGTSLTGAVLGEANATKPSTTMATKPSTTMATKPSTTMATKPSTTMATKPMKGRVATNDVVRLFHSGKNTFVNATKPVSHVELAPFLIPELNPITPLRPLPRPRLNLTPTFSTRETVSAPTPTVAQLVQPEYETTSSFLVPPTLINDPQKTKQDAMAINIVPKGADTNIAVKMTPNAPVYINDRDRLQEVYNLATKENNNLAQYDLGMFYLHQENKNDILPRQKSDDEYETLGIKYLNAAANQGNVAALINLGLFYQHNKRDFIKAANYYQRVAEQGDEEGVKLLKKMIDDIPDLSESERIDIYKIISLAEKQYNDYLNKQDIASQRLLKYPTPTGGKKRTFKRRTFKRRTFKRRTFKRRTFKRRTFKRHTYKRRTFKRCTYKRQHLKKRTIRK